MKRELTAPVRVGPTILIVSTPLKYEFRSPYDQ
jgi:hypothetical protein